MAATLVASPARFAAARNESPLRFAAHSKNAGKVIHRPGSAAPGAPRASARWRPLPASPTFAPRAPADLFADDVEDLAATVAALLDRAEREGWERPVVDED